MTAVPELLDALLRAAGPTGSEQAPAALWADALAPIADVHRDALGSTLAYLAGSTEAPVIALITHIDEIGLIVTEIDDQGFLLVESLGGWDAQILVGQRLDVHTDGGIAPGVVGRKAVHLSGGDDANRVTPVKDLRIDIGATNREQAAERVAIGDTAVIAAAPVAFPNGRLVSRALDNRVSVFAAAEVLRRLAASDTPHGDVIAIATVQEETTSAGAIAAAYAVKPDLAVVIDVTHASDAPGMTLALAGRRELGSGPAIVRGPGANPAVTARLRAAATSAKLAHTLEAMGGRTHSDADGVHHARGGIPTAIVGVPLRYMHSPVEMVQLSDVEALIALLVEFITQSTA